MEPINLTTQELYLYSLLLNVALGVLIGLVPLVYGFIKGRRKQAFLGFVLTIVGSAVLGLVLAIPMAAIWTWMVYRGSGKVVAASDDDPRVS